MTLREAAEILGLAPSTLRVQIRNGKLAAVKRGRDWDVAPAELERYRATSLSERKVHRCTARHPMHSQQVRCEDRAGHPGEHFHSFYMRHWSDDDAHTIKSTAGGTLYRGAVKGETE
jgi:excisionase family DNA binding protein